MKPSGSISIHTYIVSRGTAIGVHRYVFLIFILFVWMSLVCRARCVCIWLRCHCVIVYIKVFQLWKNRDYDLRTYSIVISHSFSHVISWYWDSSTESNTVIKDMYISRTGVLVSPSNKCIYIIFNARGSCGRLCYTSCLLSDDDVHWIDIVQVPPA